jgi:hypothetical protein
MGLKAEYTPGKVEASHTTHPEEHDAIARHP